MRLINTQTLQFEEFIGSNIPPYAILSHTWDEEEVSYKDYTDTQRGPHLKGYTKIRQTCEQAATYGLKYAWVDTCCIDKSSSAELSEAINSMFEWYEMSVVCFAYLADLDPATNIRDGLSKCRWVTRGWTLQELIAPAHLVFFDSAWGLRCAKSDNIDFLETVTGIPSEVLSAEMELDDICAAEKMSWAAHRITTRIEDMAYCLLGIFDINLPLLYGEGPKAFRRLQEEILRRLNDLSILAWNVPSPLPSVDQSTSSVLQYRSIFATNTTDFVGCDGMRSDHTARYLDRQINATNHCLQLRADIALTYLTRSRCFDGTSNESGNSILGYVMNLNSYGQDQDLASQSNRQFWLHLQKVGPNNFVVGTRGVILGTQRDIQNIETSRVTISILTDASSSIPNRISKLWETSTAFVLQQTLRIVDAVPWSDWAAPEAIFMSNISRKWWQVAHVQGFLHGRFGTVDVDVGIVLGPMSFGMFNTEDHPQVAAQLFDKKKEHSGIDVCEILSGLPGLNWVLFNTDGARISLETEHKRIKLALGHR